MVVAWDGSAEERAMTLEAAFEMLSVNHGKNIFIYAYRKGKRVDVNLQEYEPGTVVIRILASNKLFLGLPDYEDDDFEGELTLQNIRQGFRALGLRMSKPTPSTTAQPSRLRKQFR